jgi:hypothetical protein
MLLADGFRASTKLSASFFAVHRSNLLELFLHILFETYTSLSPIRRGFAPDFVNYKKRCTRLAAASDKVYQLLAHGQWFSPGTPVSSITTKTGCHYIAEILLKVALNTKNQKKKSINVNKNFENTITFVFLLQY